MHSQKLQNASNEITQVIVKQSTCGNSARYGPKIQSFNLKESEYGWAKEERRD